MKHGYKNLDVLGCRMKIKLILGKEEIISSVCREKLSEFHSKGYNANNMNLFLFPNNHNLNE